MHTKNIKMIYWGLFLSLLWSNLFYAQVQLGNDIDGEANGDRSGHSVSLDGNRLAIGAPDNDGANNDAGQVRVYEWSGTTWNQLGADIDGGATGDNSGYSVSLDGNRLAIGAPLNDDASSNAGQVRVYEWSGATWNQLGNSISGQMAGGRSGWSVSLDGNRLAIGTPYDGAGQVRVYEWSGSTWTQLGNSIDGQAIGDESGYSVSLDGNRLAIGAPLNDEASNNAGQVRVYKWSGTTWTQLGANINGESAVHWSGCSVSLDGNRLAVGARYGANTGQVRVYEWSGTTWTQLGADINGEATNDELGYSVSLDGNRLAIGAPRNDGNGSNAGQVRVYEWSGIAWNQFGTDIDGEAAEDNSGHSVSLSGDQLAIGAPLNDGNGNSAGHVRIVYNLCTKTSTDVQRACDSYTWIDGVTYTSSTNTPTDTLGGTNGCDTIITLNLTIDSLSRSTDVQRACGSYTWINGVTYTSSTNTPTDTLRASNGCDSIVTLNLIINSLSSSTDVRTACDSFVWIDGLTYTSSTNTPTDTLRAANGCDTVVTLNLTIDSSVTSTDVQTACDSFVWIDSTTYTSSTDTPTYTLTTVRGCDSIITLNLTIDSSVTSTDVQTACDSFVWIDGTTYTSSTNTPTHTLTTVQGCDSIVTLNLTIGSSVTRTDTRTACGSYTWIDGITYASSTSTNRPTYTLTGTSGCDTIVTLDLTITPPATGTDIVTVCKPYTWIDGTTYASSTNRPTYTLTGTNGCDSIVTLNLTISSDAQLGSDINGEAAGDRSGHSVSLDGNRLAIGAPENDGTGSSAGQVRVYEWSGTAWVQLGADIDGQAARDLSGYSVSLDGNRLAIGAPLNDRTDSSAGQVRVYEWSDTAWAQLGAAIDGQAAGDEFGRSVSLDGNRLAIGAPLNDGTDSNAGQVRVYEWSDTAWAQLGAAIDGQAAGDEFGRSVSLDGNRLAIGAPLNDSTDSNAGQVRVYEWSDTAWIQLGADIDGEATNDKSGYSVSLDGNRLAIGAYLNDGTGTNAGQVRVYEWSDTAWAKLGADIDGKVAGDEFGRSVSLDGDRLAIGAPLNDDNGSEAGQVRIYIQPSATGIDTVTACDSFVWIDGLTYTNSTNTPTHMFTCDSVITLDLTIQPSATGINTVTACGSYTWMDSITYTSSTNTPTYTIVDGASNGCDSIVTLDLTIDSLLTSTDVQTACDSLVWIDGLTYTSSTNTPTDTLRAANGCDSIVTLNLTIDSLSTDTVEQTACATYTWIDGITYTSSTDTPTYTLRASNGCDSIITLDLTIGLPTTGTDTVTVCEAYTWIDSITYASSTNRPSYTLAGANGCDSTVTLNLTIISPTTGTDTVTACESYTWIDSVTYASSTNRPSYTFTAANGCDSIVTLDLTIINLDTSLVLDSDTLYSNQRDTGTAYQWTNCANNTNTPIAGATNASFAPSSSGNYGLILRQNGCTDTTACKNVILTGLKRNPEALEQMTIYPNPNQGEITLDLGSAKKATARLSNVLGQVLWTKELQEVPLARLGIEETGGLYFLEVKTATQRVIFKLIKE